MTLFTVSEFVGPMDKARRKRVDTVKQVRNKENKKMKPYGTVNLNKNGMSDKVISCVNMNNLLIKPMDVRAFR